MGYDTEFGQMECLKLITESNFRCKRVGYLGIFKNNELNLRTDLTFQWEKLGFDDGHQQNDNGFGRPEWSRGFPFSYYFGRNIDWWHVQGDGNRSSESFNFLLKLMNNNNYSSYVRKKAILTAA
jgi:hypothetical protein